MSLMSIESNDIPSKYSANQFVVLFDVAEKNCFTIAFILEVIYEKQKKVDGIFFERVQNKERQFNYKERQMIPTKNILFNTDKVIVYKNENRKTRIKKKDYEMIQKKVQKMIKEQQLIISEISDEEIERSQQNDLQEIGIEFQKKIKIKGRKKKQKMTVSRKKKAKKNAPKFKKGKFNPFVDFIELSEQRNAKDNNPNYSCCPKCNDRELYRAINIKKKSLINKILSSRNKLTSVFRKAGPYHYHDSLTLAIKNNLLDIFQKMINPETLKNLKCQKQSNSIQFYETGSNNKFAYGVQTRTVAQGRKNREGMNAFTYDQVTWKNQFGHNILFYYQNLENPTILQNIQVMNQNLFLKLTSNFYQGVMSGNLGWTSYIAKHGFEKGGFGFNEFHYLALAAKDVAEVVHIKKTNVKKKSYGNFAITPMHCAAINPNPEILKFFCEKLEDFYVVDDLMRKPIHFAASAKSTATLKYLLDQGIDCRDQDKDKITPLMYAAMNGRIENIKLMFEKVDYNLNLKSKKGFSALHYACQFGHLDVVKLLHEKGADLSQPGRQRINPTIIASQKGFFDIVKYLIENGAKYMRKDAFKKSSLFHSVIAGNIAIASLLLTKGAEYNGKDSSGNTPLHFACAYGQYEMIKLLLQAGADPNLPNDWNYTPIVVALMKKHHRCVELMVNIDGIDVNCRDMIGRTFLMNTVIEDSIDFFQFLVEQRNTNVNLKDLNGDTCLHILANKNPRVFEFQNINYEQYKEEKIKKIEMFKKYFQLLIQNGGDLNLQNFADDTPFIIALKNSNWTFVQLALEQEQLNLQDDENSKLSILHACNQLLFAKNGLSILQQILQRIPYLKMTQKIFDKDGYNFLHSMLLFYTKEAKSSQIVFNIYKEKDKIYRKIIQDLQKEAKEAKEIEIFTFDKTQSFQKDEFSDQIEFLQNKILSLKNKTENHRQTISQNFLIFLNHLFTLGIDFSTKVKLIETPYNAKNEKPEKKTQYYYSFFNVNIQFELYDVNDKKKLLKPYDFLLNDDAGCSLLHLLMKNPEINILNLIIQRLIQSKKFVNNEQNHYGETILYYYFDHNIKNYDILHRLIEIGEDINIPNQNLQYPIILACLQNSTEQIKELKNVELDVNVVNKEGDSPLIILAKKGNFEGVKFLLNKNADINIKDKNHRNALHWRINNNQSQDANFQLEELLIINNIEINAKDVRGRSPMHYYFVKIGDPFIKTKIDPIELFSDFLLNENLNLDVKDNFGNTQLYYAAQRGAYLCTTILLKRKCNIDSLNNEQNTALSRALLNDHFDVVILFLQLGCNPPIYIYEYDYIAKNKWEKMIKQKQQKFKIEEESIIKIRKKDYQNQTQQKQEPSTNRHRKSYYAKQPAFAFGYSSYSQNSQQNQEQNEEQLKELAEKNFLKQKHSTFGMALDKKAQSTNYLLIENGFDISLATMQSIQKELQHYTFKLLAKRKNINPLINNKFFQTLNENNQNLFHVFTIYSKGFSQIEEKIFNQILIKNISYQDSDQFGGVPLIYAALKNNNYKLIDALIEIGADPHIRDQKNNNIISGYIQNNGYFKKSILSLENKINENNLEDSIKNINFSARGGSRMKKVAIKFNKQQFNFPVKKKRRTKLLRNPRISTFELDDIAPKDDSFSHLEWLRNIIDKYNLNLDIRFEIEDQKNKKNKQKKQLDLLGYSIIKLKNLQLSQFLIDKGCNINDQDQKGHTILTYAIRKNNQVLLEFLKNNDQLIDFSITDNLNKTYIHHCISPMNNASYHNTTLLKYLAKKIDINAFDNSGKPPIHYASLHENQRSYQVLKKLGAKAFYDQGSLSQPKVFFSINQQIEFEHDYDQYIQKFQKLYKVDDQEIIDQAKLDHRFVGKMENVYDEGGDPYIITLTKVNIEYGHYSSNLFYRMQIGKDIIRQVYVLFTNWGRVGTGGQHQLTPFFSFESCKKEFCQIFKSKTGNLYENRDQFEKKGRKYRLIKFKKSYQHKTLLRSFDLDNPNIKKSLLFPELYDLMINLTDNKYYQIIYNSFKLDEEIIPLGCIDKETIKKAKFILEQIIDQNEKMDKTKKQLSSKELFDQYTEISQLTSNYYEYIPSILNKEGAIPNLNLANSKHEMRKLLDIQNIEIVTEILCAANLNTEKIHPLDYTFICSNLSVYKLQNNQEDYSLIKKYIKRSMVEENQEIGNIFEINRKGEEEQYKQYEKSGNRRLLWHGTKTENLISIFREGLRIAPQTAHQTGAMFNSGIYFSDVFNKSIQYSSNYLGKINKPIFILLCEVALGQMKKKYQSDSTFDIHNEPEFHSLKGCGKNTPDKFQRIYLKNGAMVPVGQLIEKTQPPKDIQIITNTLLMTYRE